MTKQRQESGIVLMDSAGRFITYHTRPSHGGDKPVVGTVIDINDATMFKNSLIDVAKQHRAIVLKHSKFIVNVKRTINVETTVYEVNDIPDRNS